MQDRQITFFILMAAAVLGLSGCATLPDPLDVTVAGFEPLQGEGMELRMLVKLRVQNPNDKEIVYNGASVSMDVQNKTFATGVTDMSGTVPRFGESVVAVPVTASAMRMARQALGFLGGGAMPEKVHYKLSGKLHTSSMNSVRFTNEGELDLPKMSPATPP
ncbi:MAG: LEA type 2 family protein [Pseudomonadota bacterium]